MIHRSIECFEFVEDGQRFIVYSPLCPNVIIAENANKVCRVKPSKRRKYAKKFVSTLTKTKRHTKHNNKIDKTRKENS